MKNEVNIRAAPSDAIAIRRKTHSPGKEPDEASVVICV